MKFLSDILAKAGLTVDGVVTFNNTATGQTPATNDNSTKLATTAFIKNQSYLSANQTITVSGDATGSGTTSIVLTLANSGVSAGTYGNASNIPTIVVDAKGRITSISTNAVSIVTTLAGLSDVTLTSPSANQVLQYNGTQWVNGAAPTTYTLPIATSSILGGIKIGSGLSIDAATGVVTVSGGGGGNLNFRTIQEFTSTSGQTTYTISGGYAVGYVEVLVNGVYISENQYTATNGTTIVLTDPNTTGDIVTVFLYSLYNLGTSVYARNVDTLTATAGQTSFTTSYIPGQIDVYYNGSKLTAAEYTATTGSSIVLGQAAVSGDIIEVVTYLAGAGLNSNRTLTINGTTYDLTANRTWTLTTANISEVTNLYYTDARARAAISVTGSGSYNSSTGVITVTGGVTSVNTLTGAVVLTTTNIAEGTNLYYTDARVGTYLTTNSYATQTYVGTQIANLVASAPATLDTLNELAVALGNDPSFATTVATSIGTKVPQTRTITINGTALDLSADRSFTIAGGVTSFNTRTGAITPTSGDYTTALVTESGNLYYTDARARLALSGSTGISYNNTTGAISSTITQYTDTLARASISLSTTGTSGAATYDSATGVLNIPQYQGGVTSFNTRTGAITLTSSDVTTALTYTPVTNARTITINGTSYDLSANRSWTIAPDVSVRNTYAFTATAAQTTFTVTGGYSVGLVDVFINGVKLAAADFTATNGTTVVLGTGTGVGNIVEIVKYVSAFTTAVETTRTLTINGTTYDLSANRTWSIDNASLGAQAQLNGTGLVRMSGTTVTYDNATYATQSYVTTAVANLVNSAPSTLDTLNELATALGNDANFATTITTSIGTKQPQLNGTGFVKATGTTITYDNSTYLTTASASSTYQTILANPVTGTGTTNYLPKFTGTSTIGNSLISESSGVITLGTGQINLGTSGSIIYMFPAFSANLNLLQSYNPTTSVYTTEEHRASDYSFKIGTTTGLILNASGNLGLGVTPSAWINVKALQIGSTSVGNYSNTAYFNGNAYYASGTGWTYVNSSYAARYELNSGDAGVHAWHIAPSGTAGNSISFTQAMTLTASGRLLLGTASEASYMLDVNGTGRFTTGVTINNSNWLNFTDASAVSRNILILASDNNLYLQYKAGSNFYLRNTDGDLRLTIASTGAATFSSSVTAGQLNATTTTAGYAAIFTNTNAAADSNGLLVKAGSGSTEYNVRFANQTDTSTFFVIKGNGRVGVGTTTPADKFVVSNSGAEGIEFGFDAGIPYLFGYNRSTSAYKPIAFVGSGNVIITEGTITDSGSKLQVKGTAEVKPTGDADYFIGRFSAGNAKCFRAYQYGSDGYLELQTGAGAVITKLSGYSGTIGYTIAPFAVGQSTATAAGAQFSVLGTTLAASFNTNQSGAGSGICAYFVNNSGSGYSSFIYIGSAPGTDWKIGKNISNPTATTYHFEIVDSSNNLRMQINNGTGNVTFSGTVTQNSDIRLKKNIRSIENPLSKILQTRGVLYDRVDESDTNEVGFIAQELELVLPELVSTSDLGIKSIKYQNIVAVLVEAIKELKSEIDILKAR